MKFRPLFRKLKTDLLALSRRGLVGALAFVTVFVVVYTTAAHAVPFLTAHPYFRLTSVKVACDTKAVSPQTLAFRAGLHDRATIWDVEVEEAKAALERTDWVRNAEVTRRFPDHVSLRVEGRVPVAATLTDSGPFFIDADGMLFRREGTEGYPDLPYLLGWREATAHGDRITRLRMQMALLEAAQKAGHAVSEITVDQTGAYTLYPENPRIAVELGRDPVPAEALRRVAVALGTLEELTDSVRAIDVAIADRIVVKAADGGLPVLLTAKVGEPAVAEIAVGAHPEGGPDRG